MIFLKFGSIFACCERRDHMEEKKQSTMFKVLRFFVKTFYRKPEIVGAENLPDEPCIIVGNHTQMNGPIIGELYLPGRNYVWCAHEMMDKNEVAEYAFRDFWSFKPRYIQWYYKLASHVIVPFSVCVFNNAHTIPVYHDTRAISTFREAVNKMKDGYNMVIFPEYNKKYNNILYDFQDKFIDTARFYRKQTGREVKFVPMYVAPRLHKVFFGEGVSFDSSAPVKDERQRIKTELMNRITALAASQPEHTVVPYRNIGRRNYPKNIPIEVYDNEETGC